MEVSIKTENGQFKANLRLPRTLVLSIVVTVAGWAYEAIRCELNIRDLRSQLAQCQKQPAPAPSPSGGQ